MYDDDEIDGDIYDTTPEVSLNGEREEEFYLLYYDEQDLIFVAPTIRRVPDDTVPIDDLLVLIWRNHSDIPREKNTQLAKIIEDNTDKKCREVNFPYDVQEILEHMPLESKFLSPRYFAVANCSADDFEAAMVAIKLEHEIEYPNYFHFSALETAFKKMNDQAKVILSEHNDKINELKDKFNSLYDESAEHQVNEQVELEEKIMEACEDRMKAIGSWLKKEMNLQGPK